MNDFLVTAGTAFSGHLFWILTTLEGNLWGIRTIIVLMALLAAAQSVLSRRR